MKSVRSVLIIGGSGFLGSHLAAKLRDGYKVFATFHKHFFNLPGVTYLPFNIEKRDWIQRIIYTMRPDVVVYLVGGHQSIRSERDLRLAETLYSGGPATVANCSDILQPRLIYVSNPYVFDGTKGNYRESDTTLPANGLGKLKMAGENVIKSKYLNYVILRTSPIFGRGNGLNLSLIDQWRMKLDRQQTIEAIADELHSFAPIEGLCEMISRLIDSGVRNRILHYGGLTKITHYDFARAFAKHFNYEESLILPKQGSVRPSSVSETPMLDFSLNSTQANEILKIKSFLLEEGLDLIKQQLVP